MKRSDEEMVAYALEVEPALLPWMPELLADLEELGSDADLLVETLQSLALPADARVIDLGCGKGAVAMAIADRLALRVLGVDLFEPFVDASRDAASDRGVADLCEFLHGNILELVGRLEPADAVVYAALGDVLGPLGETVGILRRFVRPGGFLLIQDGYLRADASASFPGFEGYAGRDEMVRRLTSHGDRLEQEIEEPATRQQLEAPDEAARIRARAEQIASRHPHLRADLLAFAKDQAAEYAFLEHSFQGVVWVLRRIEDGTAS